MFLILLIRPESYLTIPPWSSNFVYLNHLYINLGKSVPCGHKCSHWVTQLKATSQNFFVTINYRPRHLLFGMPWKHIYKGYWLKRFACSRNIVGIGRVFYQVKYVERQIGNIFVSLFPPISTFLERCLKDCLKKAESKKFFIRCQYFADGENTDHMLVIIASSQSPSNYITSIIITSGLSTQEPDEILGAFHSFILTYIVVRFSMKYINWIFGSPQASLSGNSW